MGNVSAISKKLNADLAEQAMQNTARVVESLVLRGDISALNPEERAKFYVQLCEQLGLNPASQPLVPLRLNGKEILYVSKTATDQLAAIHRLNREIVDGPKVVDLAGTKLVYAVCRATHPNGRVETAVATVPLTDPVNVLMKCETKAKRRATLSILGLGLLDESEIETIPARERAPGMSYSAPAGAEASAAPAHGEVVDAEGEDAAPTALDKLADDLASAETLDAVRAALSDRLLEIDTMGEPDDRRPGKAARELACDRLVKLGLARTKTEADALMKNPTRPAVLDDYERAIDATSESDAPAKAIVLACVAWRDRVFRLAAPWGGRAKRYAVQAYSTALAVDEKEGGKQLAAAMEKHDSTPPDGGAPKGSKKGTTTPANDAQGGTAEGTQGTGTQARAPHPESAPYVASPSAWEARCAAYANVIETTRSWQKHSPAFRAAGVLEARREVAAARLQTLGSILDEAVARRVLDDAERGADHNAMMRARAARTGRSLTTVLRNERDANERANAREFAQKLREVA